MYNTVSDFYDGKSIFLTGATGFLGSVILEILLRCLPGIKNVYLLLRLKKGLDPSERKNNIFQKEVFKKLLKKSPNITNKVKIMIGDISQPNLGMNEEDLLIITEEVSIVIHCAALLSFTLPYKVLVQANVLGTGSVIDLCRKLKKCDVLVYTSTIYSNAHLNSKLVEERIYNLPFPIETVLTDLDNKTDEWFIQFLSKNNCNWPNSYTFSKSLAENILFEKATDLPVVIVRPSIIYGTLKEPLPGYIEKGFGAVEMPLAAGTGFLSVFRAGKVKMHIIPVDFVANTIIASTWLLQTHRFSSPFVVNCTCGDFWKSDIQTYHKDFYDLFRKNTLPNSLQEISVYICENWFLFKMLRIYKDLIPAFVLDVVAYFKGSKLRLLPIQRKIDHFLSISSIFMMTPVSFDITNFKNISKQLHQEDREIFYTDLTGTTMRDSIQSFAYSSAIYNWKKDKFSPNKRRRLIFVNTMLITFIRRMSLFLTAILIYFSIKFLF